MPLEISDRVSVKNSPIKGRGLFAGAAIPPGTRIMEYAGTARRWTDCPDTEDGYTFLMDLGGGRVIDPSINGNEARFINHSCDPNCETVLEGGRVFVESIKKIGTGEELTFDYCLTLGRRPGKKDYEQFRCLCGAENCRGSMLEKKKTGRGKSAAESARGASGANRCRKQA